MDARGVSRSLKRLVSRFSEAFLHLGESQKNLKNAKKLCGLAMCRHQKTGPRPVFLVWIVL
jgi:hypothetical protein